MWVCMFLCTFTVNTHTGQKYEHYYYFECFCKKSPMLINPAFNWSKIQTKQSYFEILIQFSWKGTATAGWNFFSIVTFIGKLCFPGYTVTISVGAVLLLLFWSTWLFVLTARHVLRCHHGLAPPTLLFYLLILPSHLHSILSSLSPVF